MCLIFRMLNKLNEFFSCEFDEKVSCPILVNIVFFFSHLSSRFFEFLGLIMKSYVDEKVDEPIFQRFRPLANLQNSSIPIWLYFFLLKFWVVLSCI